MLRSVNYLEGNIKSEITLGCNGDATQKQELHEIN